LLGRVFGDALIHYFNLAGAWIVSITMLAAALYFCTAFSFSQAQVWAATRFSFVTALRDRYRDWQEARLRKKMQKELDKRRAAKPAIQAQMVPARAVTPMAPAEPRRTGIERFAEEEEQAPGKAAGLAGVGAHPTLAGQNV